MLASHLELLADLINICADDYPVNNNLIQYEAELIRIEDQVHLGHVVGKFPVQHVHNELNQVQYCQRRFRLAVGYDDHTQRSVTAVDDAGTYLA